MLGSRFEPNWPATSAYVTAVGGTILSSESPLLIQSDSTSSPLPLVPVHVLDTTHTV
jgi:subtilase family serine protease